MEYANPAIEKAMRSLEAAIPRAQADPRLPIYHFRPPAQWIGDINGPIYHKGYYHIFYQHNPYSRLSPFENHTPHWGHARSKDLVYWEHLPIALCPSNEKGEMYCASGATVVNKAGTPMIFYTGGPNDNIWLATGTDDLITWEKYPGNPLLTHDVHNDDVVIEGWRDPFVFSHEGRTYMLNGGWTGTEKLIPGEKRGINNLSEEELEAMKERAPGKTRGIVSLYRAESDDLMQWKYIGALFYHPTSPDNACPNFFKLGDKWLLLMSRHNPHVVDYFLGTWDMETLEFQPEYHGTMGYGEDMYATSGIYAPDGRLIIWGSQHNYRSYVGRVDWPGCLTLPRQVSIRPDGLVGFEPVRELKKLRGRHYRESDIHLASSSKVLDKVRGDTLEIIAEFDPADADAFGMKVRRSDDGQKAIVIRYDRDGLEVNGNRGVFNEDDKDLGPFKLNENEKTLKLHVFLDKAMMEIYVNGRACYSRLMEAGLEDKGLEVFAQGGAVKVKSIDVWEMNSIYK